MKSGDLFNAMSEVAERFTDAAARPGKEAAAKAAKMKKLLPLRTVAVILSVTLTVGLLTAVLFSVMPDLAGNNPSGVSPSEIGQGGNHGNTPSDMTTGSESAEQDSVTSAETEQTDTSQSTEPEITYPEIQYPETAIGTLCGDPRYWCELTKNEDGTPNEFRVCGVNGFDDVLSVRVSLNKKGIVNLFVFAYPAIDQGIDVRLTVYYERYYVSGTDTYYQVSAQSLICLEGLVMHDHYNSVPGTIIQVFDGVLSNDNKTYYNVLDFSELNLATAKATAGSCLVVYDYFSERDSSENRQMVTEAFPNEPVLRVARSAGFPVSTGKDYSHITVTAAEETVSDPDQSFEFTAVWNGAGFDASGDSELDAILSAAALPADFAEGKNKTVVEGKAFKFRDSDGATVALRVFRYVSGGTNAKGLYFDALDETGKIIDSKLVSGASAIIAKLSPVSGGRCSLCVFTVQYGLNLPSDGVPRSRDNVKISFVYKSYWLSGMSLTGAPIEKAFIGRGANTSLTASFNLDVLGEKEFARSLQSVKHYLNSDLDIGRFWTTDPDGSYEEPENCFLLGDLILSDGAVYSVRERQPVLPALNRALFGTDFDALYEIYLKDVEAQKKYGS